MNDDDPTLTEIQSAMRNAIESGDARAESVARVNIACAYLQMESPLALAAFEEALAAVRRAHNPRSEGILSMAFAAYFVESGDPVRALELAQRGEELARKGRIGQRVFSLIQLARVLYTGFDDSERAGKMVDIATEALQAEQIANSTDLQLVIQAAGEAARAALKVGDVARVIALTRIIDPAMAERFEGMHQAIVPLDPATRGEIERLYRSWQSRFAPGNRVDARLGTMAKKTSELLRWGRAESRRAGSSDDSESVSRFIDRARSVATGSQAMVAAVAAERLPITDDDLVFVLGLATDSAFNALLPAWVVFELVAEASMDKTLKGRCLRLAAAIGHESRPPRDQLSLFQRANAALVTGSDDSLRAEVLNEIAVCHLNLREPDQALEAAQKVIELARASGDDKLGRMARGNLANALLQLKRVRDAMEIFEPLKKDQLAAGEREMADISHQNIEMCRSYLQRVRNV